MATAQLKLFAARHGVDTDAIFHPGNSFGETQQSGHLQNELSHYVRGWDACTGEYETELAAYAAGLETYEKMVSWNASMGAVSRKEYVAGFVDAWKSLQGN